MKNTIVLNLGDRLPGLALFGLACRLGNDYPQCVSTRPDPCFSEDQRGISYREIAAPWASAIPGFFGLLFLALTVGVLADVAQWPWHGGKIAGLLTALAFLGFSVMCLALSFAIVQPQHVEFDKRTRRVHGRVRGKMWLLRSVDAEFEAFRTPVIKSIVRESGGDLHVLLVEHLGHHSLSMGAFEERKDAEYWRNKLDHLLKQ